jgi:hypothetical protein
MSITPTIYAKARSEVLALFGWNANSLSPDPMLRLDCAVALRLPLDDLQGRVVRGESVDMTRMLTASEALSRLLPPTVLAAPPPGNSLDPRHLAASHRYCSAVLLMLFSRAMQKQCEKAGVVPPTVRRPQRTDPSA